MRPLSLDDNTSQIGFRSNDFIFSPKRKKCVCCPQVETGKQTRAPPFRDTWRCKCLLAFVILLILVLIVTGVTLAWYFLGKQLCMSSTWLYWWHCHSASILVPTEIAQSLLGTMKFACSLTEYRVWVLEPRVQQQYTVYISILNRNFSADLSFHNSPAFKKEAKGVQNMVSRKHKVLWYPTNIHMNNLGYIFKDPRF